MTPERRRRPRRNDTESTATLYQFTAEWLPPGADHNNGLRYGRPDYSYLTEPGAEGPGGDPEPSTLYQFTSGPTPPGYDPNGGIRYGRPERSPSLPPPDDEDRPEPKPPTG
ncbi:MAG TPA: hypothetical protein VFG68_10670 [Fimbriiglobus sp.]|nr:hypothetical protein [Fimbriiglobus sp.]